VPCAFAYPGNPVIDSHGSDRPFDPSSYAKFQSYLEAFGLAEYVEIKREAWEAIESDRDASSMEEPATRLGRTALRNALRQKIRHAEASGDAEIAKRAATWRTRFDKAPEATEDEAE
jgi:hypothetical protein